MARADAMFSRLPFSTPVVSSEEQTVGRRMEAVDKENGELRALLAAVHMRVCGERLQQHAEQGLYELPLSLTVDQLRADFEAVFEQ